MLIPHNPSKNLHRPSKHSRARQAELDDVHIIVIPLAGDAAPRVRPLPSGRAARLNPFGPPPENEEGRRS